MPCPSAASSSSGLPRESKDKQENMKQVDELALICRWQDFIFVYIVVSKYLFLFSVSETESGRYLAKNHNEGSKTRDSVRGFCKQVFILSVFFNKKKKHFAFNVRKQKLVCHWELNTTLFFKSWNHFYAGHDATGWVKSVLSNEACWVIQSITCWACHTSWRGDTVKPVSSVLTVGSIFVRKLSLVPVVLSFTKLDDSSMN